LGENEKPVNPTGTQFRAKIKAGLIRRQKSKGGKGGGYIRRGGGFLRGGGEGGRDDIMLSNVREPIICKGDVMQPPIGAKEGGGEGTL